MSRDKQIEEIEEMAEAILDNCQCGSFESEAYGIAEFVIAEKGYRKASDVAREIFEEIEKQLARYSHLHKYAEEARQVTEEFADGTPCEMTSVWDVLPLHKNGWIHT